MIDKKSQLTNLFQSLQQRMEVDLEASSDLLHPVDNGDNSEKIWIDFFKKYLPKRYKVAKATVIDCEGNSSDQLDIVIFDQQYSYLVFQNNGITYIPAESVYAAFEVKPEINGNYLNYSANKAKSLRSLKRTSTSIPTASGLLEPKPLHEIIFGVLANRFKGKNLFNQNLSKKLYLDDRNRKLTCGCCLAQGCFFVEESQIQISRKENFLIYFVIRFILELQKIGTVPAIDLNAYLANSAFSKETIPFTIDYSCCDHP